MSASIGRHLGWIFELDKFFHSSCTLNSMYQFYIALNLEKEWMQKLLVEGSFLFPLSLSNNS